MLSKKDLCNGFTLTELMIVLVLTAIIVSLAYPSYSAVVRKSRRVDAEHALMDAAIKLETYYTLNTTYTSDLNDTHISGHSQAQNGKYYYTLMIEPGNDMCPITSCFILTATPTTTGAQNKDRIKGFRLWSNGNKEHSLDGKHWRSGWTEP